MLFLSKDPTLATFLVEGLLRYWPFANSAKEGIPLGHFYPGTRRGS